MAAGTATRVRVRGFLGENHDYIALAGALLFYVVGDTVTTLLVIAHPDLVELNGFVVWIGPYWFVVAKAALAVVCYYLATGIREMNSVVDYRWVTTLYCGSLAVRGLQLTVHNAELLL